MIRNSFLIFSIFVLPRMLAAESALILDQSDRLFSPLADSHYYIAPDHAPVADIRLVPETDWISGREGLSALKNQYNDVFIRFDLRNETEPRDWIIWTRVHWQEHSVSGYCWKDGQDATTAKSSENRIEFVPYIGRKHVFQTTLTAPNCRVYVRIRTQLSKLISIEMSRPGVYHTESLTSEFTNGLFYFCLAAMSLLNLLFFAKYRAVPAFIYACALIFFGIWQSVNFGYAEQLWLFRDFIGIERTGIAFAGTFGILLMFFWKKLLFLPAYAPGINKLLNILLVPSLFFLGVTFWPGADLHLISRLSKALFILIALLFFAAAAVTARRGFRPAIFSFWGNLVFVLGLSAFFSFTSLDFLPGFKYVLYIPFTGFLCEAMFFFFSLVSRQKIIDRVGSEQIVQTALKRRADEQRQRVSRLAGSDIGALKKKLTRAMEEDKLYRGDLTLADLARHLDLTEKELSELLNSHLQKSFYSLLNHYRIREACQLLLEQEDRTVLSIGYEVGFSSLSTFNNAFAKQMGMSPRNYRKTAEKDSE